MPKAKINSFWMQTEFECDKSVELWIDNFMNLERSSAEYKVLYLCEPEEIINLTQQTINLKDKFDLILTHNQKILDECSNAELFEFGGCWVKTLNENKEFSVSTVVGFKKMAEGHYLRHDLWRSQQKITVPKKFYRSGAGGNIIPEIENNPVLVDTKDEMFDSMFHIVIENCYRKNWFTEKIIDCLQSKTVPIYVGCDNIGDWFDLDGFLIAKNLEEVIEKANSVTEEMYNSMKESIERNYELSKLYCKLEERVVSKIKEKTSEAI